MITRLTEIIIKKLEIIFDEKIDVYVILNDSKMIANCVIDYNDQLRQIFFTLQCYKNRTNQLKKHNEQFCQMIEKKKTEFKTFKIKFNQNYNENENIFEKQKIQI